MRQGCERGSIELVVLGLLAALIVALAFPLISEVTKTPQAKPPVSKAAEAQQAVPQ